MSTTTLKNNIIQKIPLNTFENLYRISEIIHEVIVSRSRRSIDRRIVFVIVLAIMGILATGHLYLLEGLVDLYLGLPAWLWIQLLVVLVLFALAWVATDIASPAGGR